MLESEGKRHKIIVNSASGRGNGGRIFTLIPYFFSGAQFGQKEVQFLQADGVTVTAVEGTLPAHLDGEIIGEDGTRLSVELLPGQLEAICA